MQPTLNAADVLQAFREMVPEISGDRSFVCDVYLSEQGVYVPYVCLKHHVVSGAVPSKHVYVVEQGDRYRIYMQGIYIVIGLVFPTRCLPWSVPYHMVGITILGIWSRWLATHPEDAM